MRGLNDESRSALAAGRETPSLDRVWEAIRLYLPNEGGGGLPPRFNPSMPITRKFFPSMMLVSVTSCRSLIDDYRWRPF